MTLAEYMRALPKAELHVHLLSTVRADTLAAIARRNHLPARPDVIAALQHGRKFRGFEEFTDLLRLVRASMRTREDYEQAVVDLARGYAEENVRYAEVSFTPGPHERALGHPVYWDGVTRGRERAAREFGVRLNWIVDIPRGTARRDPTLADYVAEVAIEGREDGVVALGLGGSEIGNPPELFAPWFERARQAGLHSVPHAGELEGASSIWGALRALQAERIGHGIRAVEDPALVEHLAAHGIALEVNVSSNLALGLYHDAQAHPVRALLAAGVPMVINTDIPSYTGATLTNEFLTLAELGLTIAQLEALARSGFEYSFLPQAEKHAFLAEFDAATTTRSDLA